MRVLTDEQIEVVCQCINHPFLALWADMGAGKTAITLHAIAELLRLGLIRRAVVVAPRAVADSTWAQEAALWDSLNHLRVITLRGAPAQRKAQASTPADVYCIGRDALAEKGARRGCIASPDLLALASDAGRTLLVVDEASSIKNPTSSRFRALAFFKWGRVIELTGTPTPQSIADVWSQIYLLDRGAALGRNITQFRLNYMRKNAWGFGWTEQKGARDTVLSRIKHLVLRLEVPPPCEVTFHDIPVILSGAERAHYEQFKQEMVASVEGAEITAVSAGALTAKLSAWASGGVYTTPGDNRDFVRPHTRKREVLSELFRTKKPSFLVLYWFNFSIDDIKAAARDANLRFALFDSRDPSIVEAWNRGEIDVLAAHPQSAGMGLNLQAGGCTEVWLTLPWSSELWLQTIARLARRGQKSVVTVYKLITSGTIDERIVKVLGGKIDVQKLILDEIKELRYGNNARRARGGGATSSRD